MIYLQLAVLWIFMTSQTKYAWLTVTVVQEHLKLNTAFLVSDINHITIPIHYFHFPHTADRTLAGFIKRNVTVTVPHNNLVLPPITFGTDVDNTFSLVANYNTSVIVMGVKVHYLYSAYQGNGVSTMLAPMIMINEINGSFVPKKNFTLGDHKNMQQCHRQDITSTHIIQCVS